MKTSLSVGRCYGWGPQWLPWRALWLMAALCFMLTALVIMPASSLAQPNPVPRFTGWVTDTTSTLDAATRRELSHKLTTLDKQKGAQIAVLMIATTDGEAIEAYATRAFQQWGLGRKTIDDGILLVVAKNDRNLRIEVGYGLEGAVPDILAGRIIREQILPYFAAGDFAQGVVAGVDSLIGLVEGEDLPPPRKTGASNEADDSDDEPWAMLGALAFMALIMPVGLPTVAIGVFAGIAFGSISVGIVVALGALVLGLMARLLGMGRARNALGSRSGQAAGTLGGFGGRGGRGGGGGSAGGGGGSGGGGGGSSGGGGASGSW